jgi:hypothetical protein
MIERHLDGFAGADVEDGSDVIEASLHVRASTPVKPEKANGVVERVTVCICVRVDPQLLLFL